MLRSGPRVGLLGGYGRGTNISLYGKSSGSRSLFLPGEGGGLKGGRSWNKSIGLTTRESRCTNNFLAGARVWVHATHLDPYLDITDAKSPHVPVLLDAVIAGFSGVKLGVFVDGTLGAAGHASRVATGHPELECVVGFDKDPLAHGLARERMEGLGFEVHPLLPESGLVKGGKAIAGKDGKIMLPVHANFSEMKRIIKSLQGNGMIPRKDGTVDGILLDLGVSSMQLDMEERGFSFIRDGPLDMRMDPTSPLTAEVLVNTWSEGKIGKILKEYGEERYWKSIARKIVERRTESPICSTQELVKIIGFPNSRGRKGSKDRSGRQKHPATRVFQALRIAVNGELESVVKAIPEAMDMLAPGGRLAIITFHSLEDRIVKWAFRQAAGMAPSDNILPEYCASFNEPQEPRVRILTRRPICPSPEEEEANVRSRSAKLRIVERL
eukprot:jgi/Picsp_1/6598/NSC_03941-R1_s-adenosyl-methyltransferase